MDLRNTTTAYVVPDPWPQFKVECERVKEMKETEEGKQISRPGIVVKIDESKIAKTAYHNIPQCMKGGWAYRGRSHGKEET